MPLIPWPLSFCTALYPVVFVPLNFWQLPPWRRAAILVHEAIHHRQQKALGLGKFCWYYGLNPDFRWRIERSAYGREIYFLRQQGRAPNLEGYAQAVSGSLYGWMIDYDRALAWFRGLESG